MKNLLTATAVVTALLVSNAAFADYNLTIKNLSDSTQSVKTIKTPYNEQLQGPDSVAANSQIVVSLVDTPDTTKGNAELRISRSGKSYCDVKITRYLSVYTSKVSAKKGQKCELSDVGTKSATLTVNNK